MTAHGAFHWNELRTWNAEKAKKFYAATLGWTYQAMDGSGGGYWIAMAGGVPVGGIFQMQKGQGMDDAPEGWSVFIAVDDLDKRLKALKKARPSTSRDRRALKVAGTGFRPRRA